MNKINNLFDTIIVPAHDWGWDYVLKEKNMWFISRIKENNCKIVKYIAFYRTSPIYAITCYSKVKRIKYNYEKSHYDIFLSGKPINIKSIELDHNKRYLAPQSIKYISLKNLLKAKKMSDIYGSEKKY